MVFSDSMEIELQALYEQYREVIENPSRSTQANQERNNAWDEIVAALNSKFPTRHVEVEQIKRKIKTLDSEAKKHDIKKRSKPPTGNLPDDSGSPAKKAAHMAVLDRVISMRQGKPKHEGTKGYLETSMFSPNTHRSQQVLTTDYKQWVSKPCSSQQAQKAFQRTYTGEFAHPAILLTPKQQLSRSISGSSQISNRSYDYSGSGLESEEPDDDLFGLLAENIVPPKFSTAEIKREILSDGKSKKIEDKEKKRRLTERERTLVLHDKLLGKEMECAELTMKNQEKFAVVLEKAEKFFTTQNELAEKLFEKFGKKSND